ncbi:MAG TPA: MFS transporter [Myxococcales bacterium]|jgi:MFS family permease|nr:MFS transporter [Myxococcales bacterium]
MPSEGGLGFALRALSHRNYRLFFAGQSVSLIGTWLTRIATSWLVYRLSGSAAMLGVIGFCGLVPTFVLAPLAGVYVDRHSRHRVIVVTQVLSMLQSFALAALALTHLITVAEIAALQLFQGLINAFDTPARQAFVVEMVEDRRDLANAIALNSSMFNGARLVGPSIGGVLIALVGEGGCFLVDGVSYLAVIASLLAMTVKPSAPRGEQKRVLQELREGWRYTAGSPPIRSMLMLLGIVSLVGMPYAVLMPVIASVRLHGGAHTLGFLMAAVGLGALGGAVSLAMRRSVVGLGRVIVGMAICFGLSLAAFAASRQLWLSLPLLVAVGYSMMLQTASTNTVLQTILEERMRGRVMAFYTMAVMGTAPFGSLLAGALADRIGAPWTIAGGGLLCAAAAGYFATQLPRLREHVRPIYQRLGILPEVAEGLRAAQDVSTPAA